MPDDLPDIIQIIRQGDPRVNAGFIRVKHDDIALVEIDMHTKRCTVLSYGNAGDAPFITLATTEDTPGIGETEE